MTKVEEEILQENESSLDDMNKTFKKSGMVGVAKMIQRKLDKWEEEEVNIAVTGRTGVGKSCFINAIRGDIDESHPYYAKVGHSDCTSVRAPFPHPTNKRLIFWDLPGAGTAQFPRKTYVTRKEIKFHSYDVFIIIGCDRFTEDEKWLATEAKKLGKIFLFVRSKVDNQINSDKVIKKKAKKESDPLKVISEIRDDCKKNLGDQFQDIYLINNLNLEQENLDFGKLIDRLVDGFKGLKADALIYSLGYLTPAILAKKFKSLRKRIFGMAALSCLVGAIPVPGTTLILDGVLIANEMRLYRKQLGLSDHDLKTLAELMSMPVDELAKTFSLKTLTLPLTAKGVISTSALIVSELVNSAVGLAVPVIGMTVGAVVSCATTIKLLRFFLGIMENDAQVVLDLLIERTGSSVVQLQ